MAVQIEEDAAAARRRTGARPLGATKIVVQQPWTRPGRMKKSPAPLLHAGDAPDLLRGLRSLRRRLPHGRRQAQEGRPQSGLPAGVLSAGVAVRGRVDAAERARV
jgi:hypothetical protein